MLTLCSFTTSYMSTRGLQPCGQGKLKHNNNMEETHHEISPVREVDPSEVSEVNIEASSNSSISIIDKLKPSTKSDLARKRKIERPKAPTAQAKKLHKSTVTNPTDPKGISPAQRVKDFPNECLAIRNGKLFCCACREELALKKSTVKNHISSGDKHRQAKDKLARKEARERDIAHSLQAFDREIEPAGSNVSMQQRGYRVKVVEHFLRAGIPLAKVDVMRSLLE